MQLYQQPGPHASAPEDVDRYFDFFDNVFGLTNLPRTEIWVNGYTFEKWRALSQESLNPAHYPKRRTGDFVPPAITPTGWPERRSRIHERIHWLLGTEPPGVPFRVQPSLRPPPFTAGLNSSGYLFNLLPRPMRMEGMFSASLGYGDDLRGELYYYRDPKLDPQPPGTTGAQRGRLPPGTKLPAILWLHPYTYATGYSAQFEYLLRILIQKGFAVFAFDQIGFGTRVEQVLRFYERSPKWSLVGRMVADTRAALDAVAALEEIDASKIYLLGYELGAKVALFTAALEDRVSGLATCCGLAPLRLPPAQKRYRGPPALFPPAWIAAPSQLLYRPGGAAAGGL